VRVQTRIGVLAGLMALGAPNAALAYIGPGAGLSVGGAIIGVLATLVLAAAMVVLWPLRVALRKLRGGRPAEPSGKTPAPAERQGAASG
jgi:hypothetical protein